MEGARPGRYPKYCYDNKNAYSDIRSNAECIRISDVHDDNDKAAGGHKWRRSRKSRGSNRRGKPGGHGSPTQVSIIYPKPRPVMPPAPLLDMPVGVMTPLEPPEAPGIFRSGGRVCTVSGREVSRQAVRSEKPAAHSALGVHTAMAAQRY